MCAQLAEANGHVAVAQWVSAQPAPQWDADEDEVENEDEE